VRHDKFVCETWQVRVWDMTSSCVRHDKFVCETWQVRVWDMTPHVSHTWIRCEWCIYIWITKDMAHSPARHDPSICATRRLTMNDWRYDAIIYETWIVYSSSERLGNDDSVTCETCIIYCVRRIWRMWDMTSSWVRHDIFVDETWLSHMSNMHLFIAYVRYDAFTSETWLIGLSHTSLDLYTIGPHLRVRMRHWYRSYLVQMSVVSYKCVMSRTNESCLV